jgi:type VI secretion system secreted protein VgrG
MSGWQRSRATLVLTSPLAADALIAVGFTGHEEISQPFDFAITVVSQEASIDADALLFHGVDLAVQRNGEPVRHFHGIVQSFTAESGLRGRGFARYRLRVVPRLWFLGQTGDCRIFQNKSVPDIVRTVISEAGHPAPVFRLQNQPTPRGYVTQYNETDLHFVSRLLQEEGCYYFFEHQEGEHTLVIADYDGAFRAVADPDMRVDSAAAGEDVLTVWQRPRATAHGEMRLIDYDPETPSKQLDAQQTTLLKTGGTDVRDVMLWPARSFDAGDVKSRARFRIEAVEAVQSLSRGEGRNRSFMAGGTFTLAKDPIDGAEDITYALRAVDHEAMDETVLSSDRGASYANAFSAFPVTVPWREPLALAKPRMEGVHAALVIGPSGTEIHTDDLGRVKVMFFWDHRHEANPDQAVWARVVYPWAGNGWGWQSTPRVGTEVAVAFMDGDPDRPVVLGGMYNGNDAPIYPVGQKTRSGIRTRSSLQGSTSNFNELTFDDDKGSELVYMQAEKDHQRLVKNDETIHVEHDQTITVDNNQTLTVKNCRKLTVNVDETVKVDGHQDFTIGNGRSATITASDDTLKVSQGDRSVEVSQGDLNVKVSSGSITMTAMQSILLKVGQTTVKLDPQGVTVNGMMLKFTGTAMLQTDAPMSTFKADAMMTLKGGIIMIN